MAITFKAIAQFELSSTASSVTFSSIPNTYTDLYLMISPRYNDGGGDRSGFVMLLNSQTTSSNTSGYLGGYGYTGSASYSASSNNTYFSNVYDVSGSAATSNTFGSVEIYIGDYTSSENKPIAFVGLSENNDASSALVGTQAGVFRDSAQISSIKIQTIGGISNFASRSSFFLYGIKRA